MRAFSSLFFSFVLLTFSIPAYADSPIFSGFDNQQELNKKAEQIARENAERKKREANWVKVDLTKNQSTWKYDGKNQFGNNDVYAATSFSKLDDKTTWGYSLMWLKGRDLDKNWIFSVVKIGGKKLDKIHAVRKHIQGGELYQIDFKGQKKIERPSGNMIMMLGLEYDLVGLTLTNELEIQYSLEGSKKMHLATIALENAKQSFKLVRKDQEKVVAQVEQDKINKAAEKYRAKIKKFRLPDGDCGRARLPESGLSNKQIARLNRHNRQWASCLSEEGKDEMAAIRKLITADLEGSFKWTNSEKSKFSWSVKYHDQLKNDVLRIIRKHNDNGAYRKRIVKDHDYAVSRWNEQQESQEFWNNLSDMVEQATSNN